MWWCACGAHLLEAAPPGREGRAGTEALGGDATRVRRRRSRGRQGDVVCCGRYGVGQGENPSVVRNNRLWWFSTMPCRSMPAAAAAMLCQQRAAR